MNDQKNLSSEEKLQMAIAITKGRISSAEIYFKYSTPGSMGWEAFSKSLSEDKIILEVLEEYKKISEV